MGTRAILYTCYLTLSSQSRFSLSSWLGLLSSCLYLALVSRMWESQASSGPWSCCLKAARTPPQPQCPVTMMSFTFKTCTEYCKTARKLMSEGGAWLATFRCTNSSPGCRPTISLAGTLESEQPIHRYSGVWILTSLSKYSESSVIMASAHSLLFSMIFSKLSILVDSLRKATSLFRFDVMSCIRI